MGRVELDPDSVVTQPAMQAVSPPTPAESGEVAVRKSEPAGEAPLSRAAVELLRRTIPRLRPRNDVERAPLDHRQGFVLSLVDGVTTVQMMIDVAGMPDGEVIAALQRLRRLGIITLG